MESFLREIEIELTRVISSGIPENFVLIQVQFDGRKKPIDLVNSKRVVEFMAEEPAGIVLSYSAGSDNVHTKAMFNALNDSGIFRSYRTSGFGLRGTTFQRFFKPDTSSIMNELRLIFQCIEGIIKWDECKVFVSSTKGIIGELNDTTS